MLISPYHLFKHKSYRNINDFTKEHQNIYDLFISAFTYEDIVTKTFSNFNASKKVWLIFPEYNINMSDINDEAFKYNYINENSKESEYIIEMYKKYIEGNEDIKICVDTTGFNKPYLVFLIIYLKEKGFKNIDFIYTEPKQYPQKDKTQFSILENKEIKNPKEKNTHTIINPRDIETGNNFYSNIGQNDLFIINVGYESRLVNSVINNVTARVKKPLLGFPSLQPIMYQENVLNLIKSKSNLGIEENEELLYAPANNPFITAHVISEYIEKYVNENNKNTIKNIYLSPLATKAQTIGITLFYIFEQEKYDDMNINIHIHYPFTSTYSSSSSEGFFRINKYTIEFDLFDKITKS